MRKKSFARRCSALLLAAVMMLSLVPVIYADDTTSISISPSSDQTLTVDDTLELTATPSGVTDGSINWTSSASDVASISADSGDKTTVTAETSGTAKITATYKYTDPDDNTQEKTIEASINITVEDKPALEPSITLDSTNLTLTVGSAGKTLTATTANGTGDVTWSSSDSNVATVTSTPGDKATVNAVAAGTAKITASYSGKTATCDVTVNAQPATVNSISVTLADIDDIAATAKRTVQLKATANMSVGEPRDISLATDLRLTWSVAPTSVATISTTGEITGVSAGDATVTVNAEYQGKTATATKAFKVVPNLSTFNINPNSITMDVGGQGKTITATYAVEGGSASLSWSSTDPAVVEVNALDAAGVVGTLTAKKPGVAKINAEVNGVRRVCDVSVSGIVLDQTYITLKEQESVLLPKYQQFGAAKGAVTWQSSDPSVAQISGTSVKGLKPGTVTVTARSGTYEATFDVSVGVNSAYTIEREVTGSNPLSFSGMATEFNSQALEQTKPNAYGLNYLTSLHVNTNEGTLYYKYTSEAEPGEGVAQNGQYYLNPGAGQKGLRDISFVPNPYYTGGTATITYTGVAGTQRFTGKIIVTIRQLNNNIALRTSVNTPLKFTGSQFNQICQRATGAPLSYVTFSIPAENRGVLYTNYYSAENYGGKVTPSGQYSQSALDEITFVPASGWTGELTLYYTGRSVGSSKNRYSGQVTISVIPENSTGDLSYRISQNGRVTFDDADFNDYCKETLSDDHTLRFIRFDSLPSSSQGTLYYNWSSASRPGERVYANESYYYGTTSPRLDRVTFQAAEGFSGLVTIPFTGQDTARNQFSGTIEISVGSSGGEGSVRYSCAPGRTVRMDNDDFDDLSRDLTGRALRYITFDSLPSQGDGTLYHNRTSSSNGTRVSTRTRYYNSSSPYIENLYFQASRTFTGEVEIPFTGVNLDDDSFTGTVLISSSGSSSRDITYTTDYQTPAVFDDEDFDDLCQWETDKRLNYVTFDLPASSQGTLYLNYKENSSSNTKVKDGSRYYRSSTPRLDQVAFVPANGYTGTAYINFKGYATDGSRFEGTVSVNVTTPKAEITVRYNTRTRPVQFRSGDFTGSGQYNLTSVQFNAIPPTHAGYLYYQYNSPTQYTRQVSSGTTYQVNDSAGGSLLSQISFVPRAGYEGTFTLPFTGTNSSNRSIVGELIITVDPSYGSSNFNDLGAYSNQARAAADFLYENNIASGVASGQYGPENSIRRGDFALMVYRAFNLSAYSTGQSYFRDVSLSDYYGQAVNTLYSLGIVSGTENGIFSPGGTLSRQDAMLMVQKAMRAVGWNANDGIYSSIGSYGDAGQVSAYAQGAMAYMIQMGLLPTSGGQLAPRAPLTRIDMAQVIHRALTY